ncbi:MAG TPA: hybrid sensor histidine kinase/response regulator [Polaromonas sp.]|uniref:hybrid sensor histidine kinase/response regulator n=1 Tax=Polaromonas sp. TaxID=1869339 RepID=UPI002D2F85E2|nr:hybrid sensor histidine kinase/response regulator [Polaromonas sp.]HYW57947.1 hybrid sensor histidine kinase/response regulator [Polaromonas sp.]
MRATDWLGRAKAVLCPGGIALLSAKSQAELLDMSFSRLRFSVYMMPLIAVPLLAYFGWKEDAVPVLVWGSAYLLLSGLVRRLARGYAGDQGRLSDPALVTRWLPRVQNLAWVHGAGLGLSVLAMVPGASAEFRMLLYVVIAHIVATNTTHQTPTFGVFLRFFALGWHIPVLLMYWLFPDLWRVAIPLGLIYTLVIYRHALTSHRYAIEQVKLKENSELLAGQFRAAKEQAEAALQEKNLFLTTASHDLRQPIHAMSLLVEAISLRNKQAPVTPLLVDLKHCMASMNQMFNALLDLSRLEAGALPQRSAPVVLNTLVRDTVTLFREQANQRGLQLRMHVPRQEAVVWADSALVRQALVNLVHNALRYTQRGGILIGLRRRSGGWQLEVCDTGIGIAEQDKDQIFSPYFRNEHAWRIDGAGHGLGLAVVARCARLMEATLGFRSRMGQGSRFWLLIPAYESSRSVTATIPEAAEMQNVTVKPIGGRCLVLDDDPQVIGAWRALLEGWGVKGRYAGNAGEAMACLNDGFTPDAIFCDQRLRSGESGFDVLRALLARCPSASGAMVSGEINSPELEEAREEGYLVLRKPLNSDQLRAILVTWAKA